MEYFQIFRSGSVGDLPYREYLVFISVLNLHRCQIGLIVDLPALPCIRTFKIFRKNRTGCLFRFCVYRKTAPYTGSCQQDSHSRCQPSFSFHSILLSFFVPILDPAAKGIHVQNLTFSIAKIQNRLPVTFYDIRYLFVLTC